MLVTASLGLPKCEWEGDVLPELYLFVCLFIFMQEMGLVWLRPAPAAALGVGRVRGAPCGGCSSRSHRQVSPGAPESSGPGAAAGSCDIRAEPARRWGCARGPPAAVTWMMVVAKRVN